MSVVVFAAAAQESMPPESKPEATTAPELKLPTLSLWDHVFNLRASAGYKDNVMFSAVNPQRSPFESAELEAMVYRLPAGGTEFSIFGTAQDTRYLGGGPVDKEQMAIAEAQLKRTLGRLWTAGLELQYLYQNQVFDTSLENLFSSVKARGNRLNATPSVRYDFAPHYYADLGVLATRQYLEAPLDNYWEGGPRLSLGRTYGHDSSLVLTYTGQERFYDTRNQTLSDGTPVPGTRLAFLEHDLGLEWEHYWGPKKHWRTNTRIGLGLNEDNGAGYWDYTAYFASQRLLYRAGSWELSAQAKLSYYHFSVQSASTTDAGLRHRSLMVFNVRGERKLVGALKVFAEYEYERSAGNTDFDPYQVNTVSGGLDLEF